MDQIPIFYRTIEDLQSSSLIMLESGNIYIGFIEIPREEWTIKKYNNYYYDKYSCFVSWARSKCESLSSSGYYAKFYQ